VAADEGDPPPDEIPVDSWRSEGGAVSRDQKAGAVEASGFALSNYSQKHILQTAENSTKNKNGETHRSFV
jgi:hypothetical protein